MQGPTSGPPNIPSSDAYQSNIYNLVEQEERKLEENLNMLSVN